MPAIEDALAINHAMAGGLCFSFYVGSTLSVIAGGFLALRVGYKQLIFYCFLILSLGFGALGFVRSYYLFMCIAFLLGLGSGLYIPSGIPLLTAVISKDYWGKTISIHETAASCAIMTIPFIAAFALSQMTWYALFWVMGGVCLGTALLLFLSSPDPRPFEDKKSRGTGLLRQKQFWMLLIVFITCGIASMGIYNIVPLFLVKEKGLSIGAANTLFGISRIGGFVAMILTSLILDRFSVYKIFKTIVLITGLSTIGTALAGNYQLLVTMLVIQATFSVVFFPVGLTVISRITTQRQRGIFTGIAMSVAGIVGPGISPVILGVIADAHSFAIGILIVGLVTTISTICIKSVHSD
jgi:NNP family nitrate/nitrite transporter-like MFS transporter